MMTHKMTINLNMLGALMENIIMRNLYVDVYVYVYTYAYVYIYMFMYIYTQVQSIVFVYNGLDLSIVFLLFYVSI